MNPAAGIFVKEMSQIHTETRNTLEKAAENMKKTVGQEEAEVA